MKTNFNFYFFLIIITGFLSALVYGLGQPLVDQHSNLFSFWLLVVIVVSISGMMRNLVSPSPVEVRSK